MRPRTCSTPAGTAAPPTARREQIEPLVGRQSQPERRVRLVDDQALHAAGPGLERVVLQHLRHRDRQRECGQRQIQPAQPQRRQADQEAEPRADDRRDRQRRPVGHLVLVHQDRGGVGADRIERAVAERDLAVEASQDGQPEDRDRVDHHHGELEQMVVAEQRSVGTSGQRRSHQQRSGQRSGVRAAIVYTRLSTVRPSRPDGFTTSTADDDDQRHGQLELGADHVGAGQVLDDADGEAAEHRAQRIVDAAQQRAGEGIEQDAAPSCWDRGYTIGATIMPATAPIAAARPQPSASIQPTRMPTSRADTGLNAAARIARPRLVWRKNR